MRIQLGTKYFILDLVELSPVKVSMLDVTVTHGQGFLEIAPIVKIKGPPLSNESGHPFTIHASWPISTGRNIFALASSRDLGIAAVDRFLSNFLEHHYSSKWIASVREAILSDAPPKSKDSRMDRTWIVLNYHPVWSLVKWGKVIKDFNATHESIAADFSQVPPNLSISWKRGLKNSGETLRTFGLTSGPLV